MCDVKTHWIFVVRASPDGEILTEVVSSQLSVLGCLMCLGLLLALEVAPLDVHIVAVPRAIDNPSLVFQSM